MDEEWKRKKDASEHDDQSRRTGRGFGRSCGGRTDRGADPDARRSKRRKVVPGERPHGSRGRHARDEGSPRRRISTSATAAPRLDGSRRLADVAGGVFRGLRRPALQRDRAFISRATTRRPEPRQKEYGRNPATSALRWCRHRRFLPKNLDSTRSARSRDTGRSPTDGRPPSSVRPSRVEPRQESTRGATRLGFRPTLPTTPRNSNGRKRIGTWAEEGFTDGCPGGCRLTMRRAQFAGTGVGRKGRCGTAWFVARRSTRPQSACERSALS